jgi:hypothetical protein
MPDLNTDAYERMQREVAANPSFTLRMVITLHPTGAMSIEAPIGDKAFCLKLLAEATEAIKRQTEPTLVLVPERDVESRVRESYV